MHALMRTCLYVSVLVRLCICIYIYIYVQASVDLVLCHVQARNSKQSTGEPRKRLANKC